MVDFLRYDFGYSWSVRYAMFVPLMLAGILAAFAVWRSWSRWVVIPLAVVATWGAVALVILNAMLNRPMPLPTERFLRSGHGRVLDVGAGSGRAAIGVLLARPETTAIGLDIYSGYWGIDENTPERFMRNADCRRGRASSHTRRRHARAAVRRPRVRCSHQLVRG